MFYMGHIQSAYPINVTIILSTWIISVSRLSLKPCVCILHTLLMSDASQYHITIYGHILFWYTSFFLLLLRTTRLSGSQQYLGLVSEIIFTTEFRRFFCKLVLGVRGTNTMVIVTLLIRRKRKTGLYLLSSIKIKRSSTISSTLTYSREYRSWYLGTICK